MLDLTKDYEIVQFETLGFKSWRDVWYNDNMPDDFWMDEAMICVQGGEYYVVIENPDGVKEVKNASCKLEADKIMKDLQAEYIPYCRSRLLDFYYEIGRRAIKEGIISDFEVFLEKRACQSYIYMQIEIDCEWYEVSSTFDYEDFKEQIKYFKV